MVLLALPLAVATLEALDPATGVDQLLLAGEEGMALVAELDVEIALGRAGGERVAAGATHRRLGVGGVDVGLHKGSKCIGTRRKITRPGRPRSPAPAAGVPGTAPGSARSSRPAAPSAPPARRSSARSDRRTARSAARRTAPATAPGAPRATGCRPARGPAGPRRRDPRPG